MSDMSFYVTMASAALAGLVILVSAVLTAWRGWLQLKQQELRQDADSRAAAAPGNATARIEIADLKERIRKLEAIAAGVDL
ncbi:hypothetical protein ACH0CP_17885 [Sphingomonas sp. 179-I 2A4 NHS]|uniref:hypothetical protein n=1 Tax=unclassified Sphingomonas TaxID=196159 RepID=UPI00387A2448